MRKQLARLNLRLIFDTNIQVDIIIHVWATGSFSG